MAAKEIKLPCSTFTQPSSPLVITVFLYCWHCTAEVIEQVQPMPCVFSSEEPFLLRLVWRISQYRKQSLLTSFFEFSLVLTGSCSWGATKHVTQSWCFKLTDRGILLRSHAWSLRQLSTYSFFCDKTKLFLRMSIFKIGKGGSFFCISQRYGKIFLWQL